MHVPYCEALFREKGRKWFDQRAFADYRRTGRPDDTDTDTHPRQDHSGHPKLHGSGADGLTPQAQRG